MADADFVLVVDPYAFSNPTSIPDAKLPWKLDTSPGAEDHIPPNLSAETAENGNSQARTYLPRATDKN
jgi:hypothetical protein